MNIAAFLATEWKKFKAWAEGEVGKLRTETAELRARVATLEDRVMELDKKL